MDIVNIKEKITEIITEIITETQDDITAYLESDVPFECYANDIDYKLNLMKDAISDYFSLLES